MFFCCSSCDDLLLVGVDVVVEVCQGWVEVEAGEGCWGVEEGAWVAPGLVTEATDMALLV